MKSSAWAAVSTCTTGLPVGDEPYNDPEAAKIMLNCGVKVTVVTLDATHSSWFGYEEVDERAGSAPRKRSSRPRCSTTASTRPT